MEYVLACAISFVIGMLSGIAATIIYSVFVAAGRNIDSP